MCNPAKTLSKSTTFTAFNEYVGAKSLHQICKYTYDTVTKV